VNKLQDRFSVLTLKKYPFKQAIMIVIVL